MHLAWSIPPHDVPPGLSVRTRRELGEATVAALGKPAREAGWSKRENVLFRRIGDHFVSAEFRLASNRRESWIELRLKPFELDPLQWRIMDSAGRRRPLSARAFHADRCRVPVLSRVSWSDSSLDGPANAAALLSRLPLAEKLVAESRSRSFAALVRENDATGAYTYAEAIARILEGDPEGARAVASDCLAGTRKRGFSLRAGRRDLHALILDFLDQQGDPARSLRETP